MVIKTTDTTVSRQILSKPDSWLINTSLYSTSPKMGKPIWYFQQRLLHYSRPQKQINRVKFSVHTTHWQSGTVWEAIYLLTRPPRSPKFSISCRYFCLACCSFFYRMDEEMGLWLLLWIPLTQLKLVWLLISLSWRTRCLILVSPRIHIDSLKLTERREMPNFDYPMSLENPYTFVDPFPISIN